MIASANSYESVDGRLLTLDRKERRAVFYLKTDPELPDLAGVRARAHSELHRRVESVGRLAVELGYDALVEPLGAGSYHVVHRIGSADGGYAVVRSTLDGLFVQDRGLLNESFARRWLSAYGKSSRVPDTYAVRFRNEGAPFDFALNEFIASPCLRDLGDAALDQEPSWLFALGGLLREVHQVPGTGAGLIDTDYGQAPDQAVGVHDSWSDYIFLNLETHIKACRDAGLFEPQLPARIIHEAESMRPALEKRPMRLLHGDAGTHNVCVVAKSKEPVCLLDWEDALVGDPLFDVALTLTFQPPNRQPPLMNGYGLSRPTLEEQRLLAFYFLRISLSKTVHRLRFGLTDQPGRTPGHHRIMRGLDELQRLQ